MKLDKKHFIIFFIIFELMQIMDLLLTYYALMIPGNHELNPLYSQSWFILIKLTVPAVVTVTLYYVQYFRAQAVLIMCLNVSIYLIILINNIFWLGAWIL